MSGMCVCQISRGFLRQYTHRFAEYSHMEQISAIQEIVDEHKEATPTEVVRVVMENAQRLYDIHANMYKLTWTVVKAHAHIEHDEDEPDCAVSKLAHQTQSLIVEAVDNLPPTPYGGRMSSIDMPHHGMVLASWVKMSLPTVMPYGDDQLVVIHSIVPYAPQEASA